MKILGLDLASSTGWAIVEDKMLIASGTHVMKKRRGESNGIMFLKLESFLRRLIIEHKPNVVAYEQAHFRGAGTELLVGFQTHAQKCAAEHKLESSGYHTGTVKKTFTGKGNASKQQVIDMVELVTGHLPKTDDEADAIAVAFTAAEELE